MKINQCLPCAAFSVALLVIGCNGSPEFAALPLPIRNPPPPSVTNPGEPPVPGGQCPEPVASTSPMPPVVCNPFGGQAGLGPDSGWIGQLWYAPPAIHDLYWVDQYETYGVKIGTPLYFNQLNVPTRKFKKGFPTEDGTLLKDGKGDPLFEDFALRLNSVIQLGPEQQAGHYQFAVLSDDGSIVRIGHDSQSPDVDGTDSLVLDNDGDHASRLACAKKGVHFGKNTRRSIQVDYFQGPRHDLSLILLWRKVSEVEPHFHDSACGRQGNDEFFDPGFTPSRPEPTWLGMIERGWRVVGPENFGLPPGTPSNPCATPVPAPLPSVAPAPSETPEPDPTATPVPSTTPEPEPSSSVPPAPVPSGEPDPASSSTPPPPG